MQDFRKLKVWQKAHQVTLGAYRLSEGFPDRERYGVTTQFRRACVSISANIAEGSGRGSDRDFARMLQIAMGSACEAEYLLLLAQDLRILDPRVYGPFQAALTEVKRMLASLLVRLRADS